MTWLHRLSLGNLVFNDANNSGTFDADAARRRHRGPLTPRHDRAGDDDHGRQRSLQLRRAHAGRLPRIATRASPRTPAAAPAGRRSDNDVDNDDNGTTLRVHRERQ
jgi:hypothetical protein